MGLFICIMSGLLRVCRKGRRWGVSAWRLVRGWILRSGGGWGSRFWGEVGREGESWGEGGEVKIVAVDDVLGCTVRNIKAEHEGRSRFSDKCLLCFT